MLTLSFTIGPFMNTIYLLLLYAAIGVFCYQQAKKRGRNPNIWLAIGLLFGILGMIALYVLPPLNKSQNAQGKTVQSNQPVPTPPKTNLETLDSSHLNKLWYYLDHDHQQFGPMSIDALSHAWREGKIHKATFVWNEMMENWKSLEETLRPPPQTS